MNIIAAPVFFVRSESGQHIGYVMPLEIAKLISQNKPPPDEREHAANRFSDSDDTNGRPMESAS